MKHINVKTASWLKFVLTLCVCACLLYGCSPMIISMKPFVIKTVKMSEKDLLLLKNGTQPNPDTPRSGSDGIVDDEPELEETPGEAPSNPYKSQPPKCGPDGCPISNLYIA